MKYNTNDLLAVLREQTEIMLDIAIREWQMLPPAVFSAQPSGGGWSAAQCLSHLNGYGDYYLPLLKRAIARARDRARFSTTFQPGIIGDYFSRMMEPSANGTPVKKMKAFSRHDPPADVVSDVEIARFIEQQETLLHLLDDAKGLDLSDRAIPVSIASFIRLKTGDTFRFMVAHNRRHVSQAQRALSAAKKSRPTPQAAVSGA